MSKSTVLRGKILLKENSLTENLTGRILSYDSTTGEVTDRPALSASGFVTSALPSAQILVGNGSGVATAVAMTGVIAITNAGVTSIVDDSIVNSDINSSAAIAYSKLNLTGGVVNADVSNSAAIAYSKLALTGSIVNADVAVGAAIARTKIASGTAYKIVVNGVAGALGEATITPSMAIVADSNGLPTASATSAAQIGYLSTLTGAVQAQLDTQIAGHTTAALLQAPTASEDGFAITWNDSSQEWELTDPVIQGIPTGGASGTFLGKDSGSDYDASWKSLLLADVSDVTADINDVNLLTGANTAGLTSTEITYLIGTTSSIQDQITGKQDRSLSPNSIWVGNGSSVPTPLSAGTEGYVLAVSGGTPSWVASSSGNYQTFQNSTTPVTQRAAANFTAGLKAVDNTPVTDVSVDLAHNFVWAGTHSFQGVTFNVAPTLPNSVQFTWDFDQFERNRYNFSSDTKVSLLSPYAGYTTATGTSYTQIVVQSADIPNSTVVFVKVKVAGVKSDGTEGYSGYVEASFRKTSGGALSIMGASTSVINEDAAGAVTGALSVSGTSIQLAMGLGGASGNFRQSAWVDMTLITA